MRHVCVLCCALVMLAGCGGPAPPGAMNRAAGEQTAVSGDVARPSSGTGPANRFFSTTGSDLKIIYEATIRLVVQDFSAVERDVPRLVNEHGGYLADVSIDRTSGEQRTGSWQARIPVDRFEAFMDAVSKLGVPESRLQTAQDVTEEYVDLEARIANHQRLEERIVKLLEDTSGEIKDVISVERELARVRGEIEQMQGRRRYLANRTELTTVTVVVREQRDYVPPESPTFSTRIAQAWTNSLLSLRGFGETAAVGAVFFFPWLFVLAVVAAPLLFYARYHVAAHDR